MMIRKSTAPPKRLQYNTANASIYNDLEAVLKDSVPEQDWFEVAWTEICPKNRNMAAVMIRTAMLRRDLRVKIRTLGDLFKISLVAGEKNQEVPMMPLSGENSNESTL
jgi:hypothetical protein